MRKTELRQHRRYSFSIQFFIPGRPVSYQTDGRAVPVVGAHPLTRVLRKIINSTQWPLQNVLILNCPKKNTSQILVDLVLNHICLSRVFFKRRMKCK